MALWRYGINGSKSSNLSGESAAIFCGFFAGENEDQNTKHQLNEVIWFCLKIVYPKPNG